MTAQTIVFYLLATLTLVSALLAVTTRHIFRAAIFLLFSLVGIAGIYFWMHYDFLAAVQIVVYVGGITVLIIFSIFLTQQAGEKLPVQTWKKRALSLTAVACGAALVFLQVFQYRFNEAPANMPQPVVRDIGVLMLKTDGGGYALPFEVISMLLLAAMIGCIVIAMKIKPATA